MNRKLTTLELSRTIAKLQDTYYIIHHSGVLRQESGNPHSELNAVSLKKVIGLAFKRVTTGKLPCTSR
jgi:hypothetical protein